LRRFIAGFDRYTSAAASALKIEADRRAIMSMKTMLIPTEQRNSMSSTLQCALLLARRFDSYIEGFALQPAISELLAVDMGAAIAPESFRQDRIEDAKKAKAMFESFMHEHGVPRSDQAVSGLSFGWLDDAPEGEGTVGSYGRLFDLIVLSRPDPASFGLDRRVLESGLFESGRPILLSPPAPPKRIAINILIAWNGSTEQTRAIAFAMPLLQQAESVKVLTIPGGSGVPGPSGEQLTRSLARNGIVATLLTVGLDGRSTGETILATAASQDCDLLIKGAYTQSRLRQLIFGGATRHILANATLPVFMAH
jgi:nucleotide-binding universal stress UspA family protein